MRLDSEYVVVGTGVAPLAAANRLYQEGHSVVLLNPQWDFFQEDSELPLDPLLPLTSNALTASRLARSQTERAWAELAPDFPGALEVWPKGTGARAATTDRFTDPLAPFVRTRTRLWVQPPDHLARALRVRQWEALEEMYVSASDAGLNPQAQEGFGTAHKFPGATAARVASRDFRTIALPRCADVDVARYRNGLLELARERLGNERIATHISQLEIVDRQLRFYSGGTASSIQASGGVLVFWTPTLTPWVLSQAKRAGVVAPRPSGIRIWEQWTLVSRERLDPAWVGAYEDMVVWAEAEGDPEALLAGHAPALNRLIVLKAGQLLDLEALDRKQGSPWETSWASEESFQAMGRLCSDFLRWEEFTVSAVHPRVVLEWTERPKPWRLGSNVRVIGGSDGPLFDVVESARLAVAEVLG